MPGEKLSKSEYIKRRTQEIYDSMPQDKELRMNCLKERDELVELNYAFFGYIASKTFINNPSVTYEDKLQSALLHFCECFWWYKWKGDGTHKGYRDDLAFGVFFKPRIGEMIERELNEVKYSIRRSLCMEVGDQIGKHWGKVKYEDLADPRVKLPADKLNSLKAIFGSLYIADLADHEVFLRAKPDPHGIDHQINDKFDTIEELLVYEMVTTESKLTDKVLAEMSDIYQIDIDVLMSKREIAERMLYQRIMANMDWMDT